MSYPVRFFLCSTPVHFYSPLPTQFPHGLAICLFLLLQPLPMNPEQPLLLLRVFFIKGNICVCVCTCMSVYIYAELWTKKMDLWLLCCSVLNCVILCKWRTLFVWCRLLLCTWGFLIQYKFAAVCIYSSVHLFTFSVFYRLKSNTLPPWYSRLMHGCVRWRSVCLLKYQLIRIGITAWTQSEEYAFAFFMIAMNYLCKLLQW